HQFNDPGLTHHLKAVLSDSGLAARRLELEVTESTLINNPTAAIALMTELKELGVRLSIDDFGTGYSSLAQLKRFPLDTLKIDRTFVSGIPADASDLAITEAIIAMAKKLSLSVVAEGVETADQRDFLARCGSELIQGYFYSPPLAAEALHSFSRMFDSDAPPVALT
ncbi:EAL domain-containing protein, partial [Laribacter hongkongensis]